MRNMWERGIWVRCDMGDEGTVHITWFGTSHIYVTHRIMENHRLKKGLASLLCLKCYQEGTPVRACLQVWMRCVYSILSYN